ncbi:MAG: TonB family protein [Bacteroidales bacterium]|nr:TonB family protein [Bacteroidales bacterium]
MNIINKKWLFLAIIMTFLMGHSNAQMSHATPLSGKQLTQEFIQQNLCYPEKALESNSSGDVVVGFHVDAEGNASGHYVKSSFSEEANPIALDLVRKIRWAPATQNMSPVDSDMEYTVEFRTRAYRRYWKKHQRVVMPLTLDFDTSYAIYETRQLEEMAKPYFEEGGNMAHYLLSNLKYPESARAAEISGTVRLSFVVETDGSVSNILIDQSVGGGCDNEAVRLLQETHWIPAVKNGKYVRSHNLQDITFNIGTRNYQDGNAY